MINYKVYSEKKIKMYNTKEIRIEEYDYPLPDVRIAKFPLPKRDESKLLVYRQGAIEESQFKHVGEYLPQDAAVPPLHCSR